MDTAQMIGSETRAWVERAVIGLNLCPFAKSPHAKGLVRYRVTEVTDATDLLADLSEELMRLTHSLPDQLETTLLIHPCVLVEFDEYNQFLGRVDRHVARMGLEGIIQIASFHPHYRFAGSEEEDLANATNRSPYPMLHLLRESSVARAAAALPDAALIYEVNIRTMRQLGRVGWSTLRDQCASDARTANGQRED